jgi:hypothetical protein
VIGLTILPPMRICFLPIRFGVLNILGAEIDMDLISIVLASVAAIRVFWRSG